MKTGNDGWTEESASWQSFEDGTMCVRVWHPKEITMAALVEYVRGLSPDLSFEDVTIHGVMVRWERLATDEEVARLERHRMAKDANQAQWQRRIMRTLVDKYGPDTSTWPIAADDEVIHPQNVDEWPDARTVRPVDAAS